MEAKANTTHALSVDNYLLQQPETIRPQLEALRALILELVPEAEEVISYGMPAYKHHGMLVGFAGAKKHIGFYPWNGHTVEAFKEELKNYKTTPGAIHLPLDKPLPKALLKKIIMARVKENIAKEK